MQNTCHPSFQDGLTNILAQTSCHKQIRAFVCDVRGCNFEAARQLQRWKWMLTTILRRSINYGSACLRATSRRLRSRIIHCHSKRKRRNQAKRKRLLSCYSNSVYEITNYVYKYALSKYKTAILRWRTRNTYYKQKLRYLDEEQGKTLLRIRPAY